MGNGGGGVGWWGRAFVWGRGVKENFMMEGSNVDMGVL
jgi:hypothetical protein